MTDTGVTLTRKDFEKVEKFVEASNLQKEIYTRYGVKIEFDGRENKVADIFEECITTIPLALTEQRERFLDLLDVFQTADAFADRGQIG